MIRTGGNTPPPRPIQDYTPVREPAESEDATPTRNPAESKEAGAAKNREPKQDYSTKHLSAQERQNLTTLYRGTWNDQANNIVERGSAGGAERNPNAAKVGNSERLDQIGNHEGVAWTAKRQIADLDAAIMFETKLNKELRMQPITENRRVDTHKAIDQLDASPERKDQLHRTLDQKVPTQGPDPRKPVEYTSSKGIAQGFAGNKATESVVEMKVNVGKYGVPGSEIERGTIFPNEAPVYSPKIITRGEADRGFTFDSDPAAASRSSVVSAVLGPGSSSPYQSASDLVGDGQDQNQIQDQQNVEQQISRIARFCAALINLFSSNSNVTDNTSSVGR